MTDEIKDKTNGVPVAASTGKNFDIVVLKFADSRVPEFKEVANKDYITCGERNAYPEYCIYQYNKCGKHRAIVNGKSRYISGDGIEGNGPWTNVGEVVAESVNSDGETMYDVMQKAIKDVEIHGGFRLFVTWSVAGQIIDIKHVAFSKIRTAKPKSIIHKSTGKKVGESGHGFWFKEKWVSDSGNENNKEEAIFYSEFDPKPVNEGGKAKGVQIFAYNEYGPGTDWYPLPEYIGCANYIDVDIEVSKFHLSAIRNGMMPSKMIQFYTADPGEEKKKDIEKRFARKFAGSENAGKFVLVFNNTKDKSVDVSDLSFNELDKQFDQLSKTVQQEIFTGHQVTSPMLFGIKTEGQLGGNTELRTAYEIFINTYAKPKQSNYEKVINFFAKSMNKGAGYKFKQLDPIGIVFDVKDFVNDIPKEYVMEKLGIPAKYISPTVSQANPSGAAPISQSTNDNVRNLTAKQHAEMLRIIRQFERGKLTKEQAALLLKTGIGFSDDEIEILLYVPTEDEDVVALRKFQKQILSEYDVLQMFNSCGDLKKDFHIIKTKKILYASDADAAKDELEFYQKLSFKSVKTLTVTEASILDLINKDNFITPEVIAETLGAPVEYVTAKIASLVKAGLLTTNQVDVGDDVQIERQLVKPLSELNAPPPSEIETTEILVKYSYEGPRDNRNRPFCAKLLELDRLYSRAEIERISLRLGYSVWDRRGGWWTKPDGEHSPSCRHSWKSNIVIRKKKGGVK